MTENPPNCRTVFTEHYPPNWIPVLCLLLEPWDEFTCATVPKAYPSESVLISLQREGWYSDKREQGMYWTSPVKCFIWRMLLSKIDLIGCCLIPLRQHASGTWGPQLPQWRPLAESLNQLISTTVAHDRIYSHQFYIIHTDNLVKISKNCGDKIPSRVYLNSLFDSINDWVR